MMLLEKSSQFFLLNMLAKYSKNSSHKSLFKNLKNEFFKRDFFKHTPDLLDNVRQKINHLWIATKKLKLNDFKKLFSKESLTNFYQLVNRTNNKQKAIFSLVIILVAAILSLIKYNQNTMQDGAVFRRSVLSAWDYTSDKNTAGMKTSLKKGPTALAVLIERDNSQIEFQLPIDNPSLEVDGNTATYINANKNIEVKYEFGTNKLKESIILNSPTNNFEFTSSFIVQNLIVKTNNENIPVFFDTNNNYQFHLERPYAIDATGQTTFDLTYTLKPKNTSINANPFTQKIKRPQNLLELETLQDIQVNTNEYELVVVVNPQWLMAPERQYPIIIDPTVIHDDSTDFSVGIFNRVTDTGSGSAPVLESYYQELTADEQTGGLWHFDEASGNVLDASGNNNTGTPTGTTVVAGRFGNARSFNGSSDYINVPANGSLNFTKDFTLEAWVKTTDTGNSTNVVTYGDSADWMYIMSKDPTTDGLRCKIYNDNAGAGYIDFATTKKINDGNWHHVACVASGTSLSAYIDGELAAISNTISGTRDTSSAGPLTIGAFNWASYQNFWNGQIDEVRLAGVARSAEEIKIAAQRRPYAIYTSPVIDLGTNENDWSAFQKLSWTEAGGQTGDGEIPSNTSGLVAQWDFNETSGGTANKSNGSCGVSCNGTLYNFATGYIEQDTNPISGWTSDSRWGDGALKFDGSNDYASTAGAINYAPTTSSPFTVEVWVKPNNFTAGQAFIQTEDGSGTGRTLLGINSITTTFYTNIGGVSLSATTVGYKPDKWYHVAVVYDGTGETIYVNGKAEGTATNIVEANSAVFTFGSYKLGSGGFFNGIMDSAKVYSRALTAAEILDNYNATNIQFQTRAGADSTPNDGSWEDWKPADESLLKDFEETYLYDSTEASLYAYWPMDETADNTCAGGADICDKKSTKHLTVSGSGSKIRSGKFNNGRSLPGGSATEYFSISGLSDFPTTAITTEFWIKTTDTTDGIISYDQGATANEWLIYDSSNIKIYRGAGGGLVTTNIAVNDGRWHHVAVTWSSDAGLVELFKDGSRVYYASLAPGTSITQNGSLVIGNDQDGEMAGLDPNQAFAGEIDELKIYNTVLDADTIAKNYLQGSLNPENLANQNSSNIKLAGNQALKTDAGILKADQYTVGLWRLNETSGTGAYIKDESGNGNHGTPTGHNVVNGFSGKAIDFNGTTSVINIPTNAGLNLTGDYTLEAWVNIGSFPPSTSGIIGKYSDNGWGLNVTSGGLANMGSHSCSNFSGTTILQPGQWYHVVGVYQESGNDYVYVNGNLEATGSLSDGNCANDTSSVVIGQFRTGILFDGIIDEVRVSNIARSAAEIAENYRAGRDHYFNYQLTANQDLSNKSTLPFYVAADRPGTYLVTTVGESAETNYQAGKNTTGLWHLDEENSFTSLPTAGGGANNMVVSGAVTTTGIIGKARYFDGTNDFATVADNPSLRINNYTVSVWIWPDGAPSEAWKGIVGKPGRNFNIWLHSNGYIHHRFHNDANTNSGAPDTPAGSINWNQWNHIVITNDGTTAKTFINGILMAKGDAGGMPIADNNALQIGRNLDASAANYFKGIIDEIMILNKASTDEEVRQLFDITKRNHPITIDFGAKLDSGNLITGSGDTSFTVDATIYGLSNKGSNLYLGDKIIIRENYNGTEYIAQGTVNAVTASTGATTVASWDSGSTFPAGGFTANAEIFKWQREFFDLTGSKPEHRNTASLLTFRLTNGHEGRTIWLDDVKAATDYLTTPLSSAINSTTGNRYVQYRTIFTATDTLISGSLSLVTAGGFDGSTTSTGSCYLEESPTDDQITLHWSDNATGELGFEIEKRINGTTWTLVDRTSANVNSYSDENIVADNTYQYRVRSFADDGSTGEWCATSVVDLGTGSFRFEGLKMEGVKID